MAEKRRRVDLLAPDGVNKLETPAGEFVKEILFPLKEKAVKERLIASKDYVEKKAELNKREAHIRDKLLELAKENLEAKEKAAGEDNTNKEGKKYEYLQRCIRDCRIAERELFIIRARIVEKWQEENAAAILGKHPMQAILDTLKFAASRFAAIELFGIENAVDFIKSDKKKNPPTIEPRAFIYRRLIRNNQRIRIIDNCISPPFIGIDSFIKALHKKDSVAGSVIDKWIDDIAAKIIRAVPKDLKAEIIREVESTSRKRRETAAAIIEAEPIEEDLPYDVYGTGSTLQNTAIAINYVNAPEKLPEVEKSINRHPNIEVKTKGNQLAIITATKSRGFERETIVKFDDATKMIKENSGAAKLLNYLLARLNEQAYSPEEGLKVDKITFSLDAAHKVFKYKNKQTTRHMIERAADALTGLKIKGTTIDRKGEKIETSKVIAVLFPYFEKKRGVFTFMINPMINWSSILECFTILPKYAYSLSSRAFKLSKAVSERARQSVDEITKHGYFTISNRTLQKWLNLPLEGENKNPARDIIEQIEKAIVEIENTDKGQLYKFEHGGCSESAGIKEYLAEGFLKVYPQDKTLEFFRNSHNHNAKKAAAQQKRTASRKKKPVGKKNPEQNTIIENIDNNNNP